MHLIFILPALHICIVHVYSSENVITCDSVFDEATNSTIYNAIQGKHESLLSCSMICFESNEHQVLPNGSLFVYNYNKTWNKPFYMILHGTAHICDNNEEYVVKDQVIQSMHLTLAGMGISMICLFVHLIVFLLVPDLRNLPGWNLASLCLSLFLSYLILLIVGIKVVSDNRDACIASACLAHFLLMASFLWMSIISYDVYMSLLRASTKCRRTSTKFNLKKFSLYSLCTFGVALLFAIIVVVLDVLDILPREFKPGFEHICWFSQKNALLTFFAGPVIALICLNFIFFGLSAYVIHFNKIKKDHNDHRSTVLKKNYLVYFRLSVIMGVTWIVGILAPIVHADWLWHVFSALNSLQGVFIFIAFTCKRKVLKYFQLKFFGPRTSAAETLTQTFECHSSSANKASNV